jgi:hypothetical protein
MGPFETGWRDTTARNRLAGEINVVGSYSRNDDWGGAVGMLPRNAVGFESFTTFASPRGDFLVADVQARFVYDERDVTDASWALEVHNAWLRWKLGLGRHLRLGHFSPAYGLEPVTDTHGRLLQTLAMADIGFKHDWGVGYEGFIGALDYRVAAQSGSGMGLDHDDRSYLLSARAGSPESEAIRWGVSALHGRALVSGDQRLLPASRYAEESVQKNRIGADLRYPVGPLSSAMEVSWGEDDSEEVLGATASLRLESVMGTRVSVTAQGRYWSTDPGHGNRTRSQAAVVVAIPVNAASVVRVGYSEDMSVMDGEPRDRIVAAQFYHLGL